MPTDPKISATDKRAALLGAITGNVDLPPIAGNYVFGLLVTAITLLLLPMLYLALIVLVSGAYVYFIRNTATILPNIPPMVRLVIQLALTVLSVGFILGLLKPFLAATTAVKRPRVLRRDSEPILYAYVDRLCDAIGAPQPMAIHINCDLNAGAEIRRGWFGLFGTRGVSLHLGMPLVGGLSLQQFTGILAHELGHFTQNNAMWLENSVRRTNLWFFRAAFEGDAVDEWLMRHYLLRGPMFLVCFPIQCMVWLTRRVFLGLAFAGTKISCMMSRQMEFNADRCQVRTVGVRSFVSTIRRLRELAVAHEMSFRDVVAFFQEGRLPDDMIALSVANSAFITPKVKKKLRQIMIDEKTGTYDSHPSDKDRIAAAASDGSAGIFPTGTGVAELPASELFSQFSVVSKAVTEQYYRDAINSKIQSKMLHPVDKLLARQTGEIEAAKALRRYFQTEIPRLRPLPIAPQSLDCPDQPKEVANELKQSRFRMLGELEAYKSLVPRYVAAEDTLMETIAAQTLIQAKIEFEPADFHLKEIAPERISQKQSRAREGVAHLAGKMLPFETEAGNRLSFALQLLHVRIVMEKIPMGEDLWYQVNELIPTAQTVSRLIGELPKLRVVFYRLMILWERSQSRRPSDRTFEVVFQQMKSIRSKLVSLQAEMGDLLYPFDHADARMTIREFALPQIPEETDLGGIVNVTEQMQSRLVSIQMRLFARLAQAAEKVEKAIGMAPLPEPSEDESD